MNKCLSLFLLCGSLYGSYEYHMQMSFKRGPTPNDQKIDYRVNEKDVLCYCGRKPVCSMFFYGNPEHFCDQHIPEIERVNRVTLDNVQDFLDSLDNTNKLSPEMNMNGAHQGLFYTTEKK